MIDTIVRKHWGWTGSIESDCGAVEGIASHRHGGYAKASVETAAAALNATISVDCSPAGHNAYTKWLRTALETNVIQRSQIEDAVTRIYEGRFRIGEFDPGHRMYMLPNSTIFSEAHQQLSLESAKQSIVLLRNNKPGSGEGFATAAHLPLALGQKIAVVGPNGNSSYVFQGSYHTGNCPQTVSSTGFNRSEIEDTSCLPTAYDEIARINNAAGGSTSFISGCSLDNHSGAELRHHESGAQTCSSLVDLPRVQAVVNEADVVILMLGLAQQITNGEGVDRGGYGLPGRQQTLVEFVASLQRPTVAVVFSGGAVGMDFIANRDDWPLLLPGYGGRYGPVAIAEALFGRFSPSGKLSYTIYKEDWAFATPLVDMSLTAGEGRTYKWLGFRNASAVPAFAFGSGTSYTTFALVVKPVSIRNDADEFLKNASTPVQTFSVHTTNTGSIAGATQLHCEINTRCL